MQFSAVAYSGYFVFMSIVIIVFLYLMLRFWHILTPTHIFELSVTCDVIFFGLVGDVGLMVLQRFFKGNHPFCYMSNLLGMAAW